MKLSLTCLAGSLIALGLAACNSTQTATVQNDLVIAQAALKTAGCDIAYLNQVAQPIIMVAIDEQGQKVAKVVSNIGASICTAPVVGIYSAPGTTLGTP